MRYHVISNDTDTQAQWVTSLREHGFDVVEEYDPNAIIITLGGDGTILSAARTWTDPTIFPVRTSGSKGYKTSIDSDQLIGTLRALEEGNEGDTYTLTEHQKIAAYRDRTQLQDGFDAVNEVNIHHSSPTLAAVLSLRIRDQGECSEFDRIVGDGLLVATPFGSTAYYRSITSGHFSDGLGVAFNNVHTPVDTPEYLLLSRDAIVEVEMVESEHASMAVVTRDNADDMYELTVGDPVEIRYADESIEILEPFSLGT